MPLYSDSSYHYNGGAQSYSPFYVPTTNYAPSYSVYNRVLLGTYSAPPVKSTFGATNRHYKPMLTPISESAYAVSRRPQNLASLTRINSPKLNIHATYIPPRPIQINTADIDVSSSRFNNRSRITKSSDNIVYSKSVSPPKENESLFMPIVDQDDPPQNRATIKRDRNIVRLSTVRKSHSNKDNSSDAQKSSTKEREDDAMKETQPSLNSDNKGKTSWRDKFGDDLVTKTKDVTRKTPGELILEKHIIKPKQKKLQEGEILKTEIMYLEPKLRKSIRRRSLAKCPSFKDICDDISADLKINDDLNAGDLRRRASLIFEEEQENILKQIVESRAASIDAVLEAIDDQISEPKLDEVSEIKTKSKQKCHIIPVEEDNLEQKAVVKDVQIEQNKSPKWKVVVEQIEENNTIHKVFKLPKKKPKALIDGNTKVAKPKSKNIIRKSESGEDFWSSICTRETVYYDQRRREHLELEMKKKEENLVEATNDHETMSTNCVGSISIKELEVQSEETFKDKSELKSKVNVASTTLKIVDVKPGENKTKIGDKQSIIMNSMESLKHSKISAIKKPIVQYATAIEKVGLLFETVPSTQKPKILSCNQSKIQNAISSPSILPPTPDTALTNNYDANINNSKNILKIQPNEPSKNLAIRTPPKITTGLKAKSPEIKQKQTKVENFVTMKEENKIPPTTTDEHKSAAENINIMIKGVSGSNATVTDDNDNTCDNINENSSTETRSVKRSDNKVTSSPKMSPIYRNYDEIVKTSTKSSTKKLKEHKSINERNKKSLSADTNDDFDAANSLSKFPTVANLNSLSLTSNNKSTKGDEYCISGEESDVSSVYCTDSENLDSEDLTGSEEEVEMGLKRRHHRQEKKKNFDPKRVVKLDHKRKCYIVDERPKYPLIATPRPLQKRWHYYSESETESEDSSDNNSSDESCFVERTESGNEEGKEVRISTCSNDSGFEGGTAPTSPKKMLDCDVNCHKKCEKLTANLCGVNQKLIVEALSSVKRGVREARESPCTPPSLNKGLKIDSSHDDLDTSYTFAQFQRSGRITAPATTIPRFKKYAVDDFHFLTVLGKGSFGKVLLAELRNTEYYYAVKCLKKDVVLEDDDVECTLIERKVLALGTKHPYLCHLFCTFQTESHLFFVMEYLNGGDLMFHIQVSGRFPETRAKFYAAEIISGLKFLHKKGIIYRDLKLDNILLDFDGHVRIADFGMCKLQIYLDRTADSFCGTPDYMAPEVIKGVKYNQAVDWWSFGVLLYEMLIGQSPFSGCDEDELFWSICNEIPWYPFYLSKDALNILSKLLEKDSNTRMGAPSSPHEDITDNAFFNEIDWKKLERRLLEPPFKPQVKHPLDTQYFDRAFTRERVRLTPIDKEILQSMDQQQFQGFTYTNPNATPT